MALLLLLCSPVWGSVPSEVFDDLKFIHYDLYDYSPEEQAQWEASRYAEQALRLDIGSVAIQEVFAIEEAQANVSPVPWFGIHVDLRDDKTQETEVGRLSVDAQFWLTSALALVATGSPDILKDQGALGFGAMLASSDRRKYAVLRLLEDRPFFNRTNPDHAALDQAVYRLESEFRWTWPNLSAWLRADLGTPSAIRYPMASVGTPTAEVQQRSDLDFHLRWTPRFLARRGGALGIRGTLRFLENGTTTGGQQTQLRRALAYGRAYLDFPLVRRVRLYSVLLGVHDQGHGLDGGQAYRYHRWDLGLRTACALVLGPIRMEGGYVFLRTQRTLEGEADPLLTPSDWGDKIYASMEWRPKPNIYVRFLIGHQVFSGNFGGMNGALGATF